MFVSWGSAGGHIRAGKLRPLGVTTLKRSKAISELPTIAEAGVPGYDSGVWYAILAPRATPAAIVNRLHTEISALLKTSDLKDRYNMDGLDIIGSTPDELTAYMKTETVKWAEVIKRARIRVD